MAQDAALGLTVLFAAMLAARLHFAPGHGRPPWLTLTVMLLVAAGLAAQLVSPGLLPRFERNGPAIADGQSFRLFTALWFQDGGLRGGLYNLAMLLIVGASAEQYWDRRLWLLLYFGVGLAIEELAMWWQPVGAGNSIAVFGLAGSLLALTWERKLAILALRAIGLIAALALAWQHDIHGAAAVLGAISGLAFSRSRWVRNQNPVREFSAA